MDFYFKSILICSLLSYGSCNNLLKDFLNSKAIRYLTIATCDLSNPTFSNFSTKNVAFNAYSFTNCCGKDNELKMGIYLKTDCANWDVFVAKMAAKNKFRFPYHWLIETSNYSSVIDTLSTLPLSIDCEITVAELSENDAYFLYDVYHSGFYNHGYFNATKIGVWNSYSSMLVQNHQYKYANRVNMSGVVLKCMIVVTKKLKNETFEYYISTPTLTHIDSMNRFNYALLLHIKDMFNFRYEMMRTNSWGYLKNGTFDGMVGYLQKKQIDVGGSPIFFRSDRAKVIDYTAQTWTSRPCFIFRHPTQLGPFYTAYVRPFEMPVWYCTVTLLGLVMIGLRAAVRGSADSDSTWSFVVLTVIGALSQQGFISESGSSSHRMVLFLAFLFALTMYQFYSACITSSLLMEAPKNLRTLEDLLASPLRAGIEDIVYTHDYFRRTTDPIAIELYNKKIASKTKNFYSAADGLALVKRGGFAFHVDIATGYRIIRESFSERQVCDLVEVQLFPPQRMVAVVQKGSPYREIFTYGLRKLAESGLMHRQRHIWHEPRPRCVRTPDSGVFSVDLRQFSMALFILAGGAGLSAALLVCELLYKHLEARAGSRVAGKNAGSYCK